jgi:uncharacterized protein
VRGFWVYRLSRLLLRLQSAYTNPITHAIHEITFLFSSSLARFFFEADPHAIAASFDCGKAANTTERPTYENAQISALDDKLQQAYKAAQATAAPSSKKDVDRRTVSLDYIHP